MITILLTCLLAAGGTFTTPAGWEIDKIVGGGVPTSGSTLLNLPAVVCGTHGCLEPDRRTHISLRRTLAVGEVVQAPEGCEVSLQGEKP